MAKLKWIKDFETFLAIVSILGFMVVFFNAFFKMDISQWVDGFIFITIGLGLAIIGKINSIRTFLRGGLTPDEISHILTAFIGVMSVVVGILSLPLDMNIDISVEALNGIKGTISLFAIILISIETWFVRRR